MSSFRLLRIWHCTCDSRGYRIGSMQLGAAVNRGERLREIRGSDLRNASQCRPCS
jgi:hypothetical protein